MKKAIVAIIIILTFITPIKSISPIENASGCDCESGCELEIGFVHHKELGISVEIKNVGDSDCNNIKWKIAIEGGIILLGGVTCGTIVCIPPGESVIASSDLVIGLGRTTITISVWGEGFSIEEHVDAFIFIFFIKTG